MRTCQYSGCGKELKQKPTESDDKWAKRRTCDRKCGARLRASRNEYVKAPVNTEAIPKAEGGEIVLECTGCKFIRDGLCIVWTSPFSRWFEARTCKMKEWE